MISGTERQRAPAQGAGTGGISLPLTSQHDSCLPGWGSARREAIRAGEACLCWHTAWFSGRGSGGLRLLWWCRKGSWAFGAYLTLDAGISMTGVMHVSHFYMCYLINVRIFWLFFKFNILLKVCGVLWRHANMLVHSIFRQNKIRLCMKKCSYEWEMILVYERWCMKHTLLCLC